MENRRLVKIKMWILVIIILLVIMEGILFFYINPTFGGKISKEEKKRYVIRAENYIDGKFKYLRFIYKAGLFL